MSESILIVDEIATSREELARALEAEGFSVTQSESASSAVRDIWENQFLVVFVSAVLSDTNSNSLVTQLQQMAPEIETIIYSKGDKQATLVRKAIRIRDGDIIAA